jgi:hypothetical protein
MLRASFFTCLLAFFSLFALAHVADAQTANTGAEQAEAEADTQLVLDQDKIERAYRAIKRDDAYQFDLAEPIPRRPASSFEKTVGRFFSRIFSFIAPLLEMLFWLGLGALGLGALYLIGRAIYETRFAAAPKKTEDAPDIPLYQPARAQARILLEEVDKLAAEGRYGEAVHTLLFRSIQDIDRNRPNIVRRSLTSREIGSLSVLTAEARTAFSTIAGVSELAHFGGVAVNKSGFETARAAYAELTGQTPSETRRRSRR